MQEAASAAVLRPAAVVFDNDGTFLETESVWSRAEEELFRRRGLPFLAEHKLELIGTSFVHASESLERFLGEPGGGPAIMEELVDLVHRELDGEVPVMPGGERLVDALRARGIPVAMATNAARGFAEKALDRAGHAGTFSVLLTAEDVTDPKPAPDIYLAADANCCPSGGTRTIRYVLPERSLTFRQASVVNEARPAQSSRQVRKNRVDYGWPGAYFWRVFSFLP